MRCVKNDLSDFVVEFNNEKDVRVRELLLDSEKILIEKSSRQNSDCFNLDPGIELYKQGGSRPGTG